MEDQSEDLNDISGNIMAVFRSSTHIAISIYIESQNEILYDAIQVYFH